MTEGIEFHEIGTIDVTFDDKTYHLGRPKLKQWRYFSEQIQSLSEKTRDKLNELVVSVAEAANAIEEEADPTLRGVFEIARDKALAEGATDIDVQVRDRAWADIMKDASSDLRAKHDAAVAAMQRYLKVPFYVTSSGLVKKIFQQLGDPLPDDIDDWPVWLATDITLTGQILNHWKTHPKASGALPPNQIRSNNG